MCVGRVTSWLKLCSETKELTSLVGFLFGQTLKPLMRRVVFSKSTKCAALKRGYSSERHIVMMSRSSREIFPEFDEGLIDVVVTKRRQFCPSHTLRHLYVVPHRWSDLGSYQFDTVLPLLLQDGAIAPAGKVYHFGVGQDHFWRCHWGRSLSDQQLLDSSSCTASCWWKLEPLFWSRIHLVHDSELFQAGEHWPHQQPEMRPPVFCWPYFFNSAQLCHASGGQTPCPPVMLDKACS